MTCASWPSSALATRGRERLHMETLAHGAYVTTSTGFPTGLVWTRELEGCAGSPTTEMSPDRVIGARGSCSAGFSSDSRDHVARNDRASYGVYGFDQLGRKL